MGMLSRIRRVLRANINEMLERAEDPANMLNFLILEMQETLEQTQEEVATAMAAEARLAQLAQEAEASTHQWDGRARRAVEHGEDDLAREALRRKLAAADLARHYGRECEQQARAVAQMRDALDNLRKRLQEAKARRVILLTHLHTAQAQRVVARSLRHAVVGNDAFAAFDRLALHVENERLKSAALVELTNDHLVEDAFLVGEETTAVEGELTMLKREVHSLPGEEEVPALEQYQE
ncbi:MAG: PspA/IM30 family protein [Armatimonadota bacterium]